MLQASFERITPPLTRSWRYFERLEDEFPFAWHYHRECELTLIVRGHGTRFVGNSVEDFRAGDLVLIGPGLPHTYASAPGSTRNEAIVCHFAPDFLGRRWLDCPEFSAIAGLLDRSHAGIHFPTAACAEPLDSLGRLEPADQTIALLAILTRLARVDPVRSLVSAGYVPSLGQGTRDRVDHLVRFILDNLDRPLTLPELARVASMTPSSVSRFFRRTTGLSITEYIIRVRISHACRQLLDDDAGISEIAAACGFQNLSNFNRQFRRIKGVTPRQFRTGAPA